MLVGEVLERMKPVSGSDPIYTISDRVYRQRLLEIPVIQGNEVGLVPCMSILDNSPTTKIGSLVVSSPAVTRHHTVGNAVHLMVKSGFCTLPVVESVYLGVVRDTSLVRFVDLPNVSVSEIMKKPKVVKESDSLAKVRSIMRKYSIDAVPVGPDSVVTFYDVFRKIVSASKDRLQKTEPRTVLSAPVSVALSECKPVRPDTSIRKFIRSSVDQGLRTLPVVSGKEIVGLISRKNVLDYFVRLTGKGVVVSLSGHISYTPDVNREIKHFVNHVHKNIRSIKIRAERPLSKNVFKVNLTVRANRTIHLKQEGTNLTKILHDLFDRAKNAL